MRKPVLVLSVVVIVAAFLLAVAVELPQLLRIDDGVPFERRALAARIASQPTDFRALSAITERALDWPVAARTPLWRSAHLMARRYAPHREDADIAFIKSGFFHWGELSPSDQHDLVEASVRLMRNPRYFDRLLKPVFEITRSVAILRRSNPGTIEATASIARIAVTNGDFDAYRSLRAEILAARLAALKNARHHAEIFAALGESNLTGPDVALAETALAKLAVLPQEEERANAAAIHSLAEFALEHQRHLEALLPYAEADGLLSESVRARIASAAGDSVLANAVRLAADPSVEPAAWALFYAERARRESARQNHAEALGEMALALTASETVDVLAICSDVMTAEGRPETAARCRTTLEARFASLAPESWRGLCGGDICSDATAPLFAGAERSLVLRLAPVQSDEYPAFVQVTVDDEVAMDGPLPDPAEVRLPIGRGLHRVRVRIANPRTRNGSQRRIKIAGVQLGPGAEPGHRPAAPRP